MEAEYRTMEKRVLTPVTVERALLAYERRFGMSTAEFYDRYYADDPVVHDIPRRHASRWASLHRTLERMSGGGAFADRIERELEPA